MKKRAWYREVSFETQTLQVEQEYPKGYDPKVYSDPPFLREECLPAKLIYQDENNSAECLSLKELGIYLQSHSIDLLKLAQAKTNELADFLSYFLGTGRVIKNHPLYEFLRQEYNIKDSKKCSPKIKAEYLTFIAYKPRWFESLEPQLTEIELSLIDLQYQKRELYECDLFIL